MAVLSLLIQACAVNDNKSLLVVSHRGNWRGPEPEQENSLSAFASAISAGANGVETDVRQTRDGHLVLVHNRLLADGREVARIDLAELERSTQRPATTLCEALREFPDAFWNIEVKDRRAAPQTVDCVLKASVRNVLLTSFQHDVVRECASSGIECGLLIGHRPVNGLNTYLEALIAPNLRTLVWDYELLTSDGLASAINAGWRNFVYGETVRSDMTRHADLQGVITDFVPYRGTDAK